METSPRPELFLTLTEEQSVLRDSWREVLEREMSIEWTRAVLATDADWDRGGWKLIRELGWTGLAVPEEFGGVGLGLAEACVLAEELGRVVHPSPLLASAAVALALGRYGSPSQQRSWLPGLADGSIVGTRSVDVDGACGAVIAERTGADLRLHGVRHFVPAAAEADLLLLDVILDGSARLALVPGDAAGLRARRMSTVDLARAYDVVAFEGVEIDGDALLGGTLSTRARGHLAEVAAAIQCAESLGAARRLLEMTVEYAGQRHQFGKPIGSFQAIKHRVADMRIRLEASTVASRYATWAVTADRPDAGRAIHVAKQYGGEAWSWIASQALQLHGGVAFTWEHDLHLLLRRLKANELTLGSPDWHALELGFWRLENASG